MVNLYNKIVHDSREPGAWRHSGIPRHAFRDKVVEYRFRWLMKHITGNRKERVLARIVGWYRKKRFGEIDEIINYCIEDGYFTIEGTNIRMTSKGEKFISWWYPIDYISKHYLVAAVISAITAAAITAYMNNALTP